MKWVFAREEMGQSSVEAALLLPTLLITFALLLQPLCVLYTRSVMASCASELCRLLVTKTSTITEEEVRAFGLRRLRAIPDVAPFHGGGEDDWVIETSGSEGSSEVSVKILGHVPLLPFFSTVTRLLGVADSEGLLLEVSAQETLRPDWLSGSYSDWVELWDGD